MADKLSSAKARLGARMMLGPYAEVRRAFSIERKERFQVGVNLGDGRLMLMGVGGSWEEALVDCEAKVKQWAEREKAALATAAPPPPQEDPPASE